MLLSVCMVVRDEAHSVARSLYSLREIADELIVVDMGSYDQTVQLAKEQGARVFAYHQGNRFQAMNYALQQARGKWVFFLEAREELINGGKQLRRILRESSCDGFYLPIIKLHFERDIETPYLKIRLFRRDRDVFFQADSLDIAKSILKKNNNASIKALQLPIIKRYHFSESDFWSELSPGKLYYLELTQDSKPESLAFTCLKEGIDYYWKGEFNLALEWFERGYRLNSGENQIAFLKNIILLLLELKQYIRAEQRIKEGLKKFPQVAVFTFWQGYLAFVLKDYPTAVGSFKSILAGRINLTRLEVNAYLLLGLIFKEQGKKAQASFYLEKAYLMFEDSDLVLSSLVDLIPVTGGREVLSYLQKIKQGEQHLPLQLVKVFYQRKEYGKGMDVLKVLSTNGQANDEVLYWHAKLLLVFKKYQEAAQKLRQISPAFANYEQVLEHLWLINLLSSVQGESKSVVNQIKLLGNKLSWNLIKLFNEIYFYGKEVWFQFNNLVAKLRFYRKAVYYLGLITEYAGKRAIEIMVQIIKSMKITTVNRDLGQVFYEKGKWQQAYLYLQENLTQGKTLPELKYLADTCYYLNKREERAGILELIKQVDVVQNKVYQL